MSAINAARPDRDGAGTDGAGVDGAGIKVGLHALGIGNGSKPDVLAAVAERADQAGFATLWCGEHVVMVDQPESRRGRRLPVIVGGTTDAALGRVAAFGDGWYGFNLPASEVPGRLRMLAEQCEGHGRRLADLIIAVSVRDASPDALPSLAAAGVTEFVVVAEPPAAAGTAAQPGRISVRTAGLAGEAAGYG